MPWFCPKPSFVVQVVGFPIGLSPRTMQCLGSAPELSFSLSSGISWGAEQEVVLGNAYSSAWAVALGLPCKTGLGREFTSPTN